LKDLGVDGRMGSKWILGILAGGGVEWINLAQVRDWRRALVDTVMNFQAVALRN
jgi:hypothetical protein